MQSYNGMGANPGSYNPASQDQTPFTLMLGMENHVDPTQIPAHPGDTFRPPITQQVQRPVQQQQQPLNNGNVEQLLTQLLRVVNNLQQQKNTGDVLPKSTPNQQFSAPQQAEPSLQVVTPVVKPIEIPIKIKLEINITPIVNSFRQEED